MTNTQPASLASILDNAAPRTWVAFTCPGKPDYRRAYVVLGGGRFRWEYSENRDYDTACRTSDLVDLTTQGGLVYFGNVASAEDLPGLY